ncbi:1-deoxy-D-xylulose-5-phosphate reductoisomerase [Desulfurispira natronophila]|uniref:1-deoxy-D-xylulose 5-phosphate reductoisomerase n=1 Tax=Desulfurispira natronophila TaxID=682562 RepID=A0A7W7Y5B9_9BACT|nr:1-deoxy-D-xylulose-5-phosphate reductoisomerase [Desulfurispira natronophila]
MPVVKSVAILGSTGSIGCSALEIVRLHRDKVRVVSLAAGRNRELLLRQICEFEPQLVSVTSREDARWLQQHTSIPVYWGPQGLSEVVAHPSVELVLAAMVGSAGLAPVMQAIELGRDIALANKEILVAGGELVMAKARQQGVQLLPVDSEHSAIMQSLKGHSAREVARIILTASGGSFRDWSAQELAEATIDDALNHPNWSMGQKITIDSATMMNKGLELIEARWLFDVDPNMLEVIIHPESIVHSMVEYVDGSVIAQMGVPDMKAPIAYALFHPRRYPVDVPALRWAEVATLNFSQPDLAKYPCLALAQDVMCQKGSAAVIMNGANEIAVSCFLRGEIPFSRICAMVEQTLQHHQPHHLESVEHILELDQWSRQRALELAKE